MPTSLPTTPLILVEDMEMARIGLRLTLEQEAQLHIVAEATTGQEAIAAVAQHHLLTPLVLMDIGLPDMDGIEATQRIKETYPNIPIMMLTSKDDANDVFAALAAGADAYCLKGASLETLKSAIATVAEGASWLDAGIARLVLARFQGSVPTPVQQPAKQSYKGNTMVGIPVAHAPEQTLDCPLTPREMEVLKHIVEGFSNADIAEKLVITKATAKAHVHSILQKLCVDDRTQAAVLAMRQGIVPMDSINPIF